MAIAEGGAQARLVRVFAICAVLAACGPPEATPGPRAQRSPDRTDVAGPRATQGSASAAGLRAPEGSASAAGPRATQGSASAAGPRATQGSASAAGPPATADVGAEAPRDGRLGDAVAPVAYDLTLEVDPARATFAGRVEIALTAAPGTRRIWLHADQLELRAATITVDGRRAPVAIEPAIGALHGFALAQPIAGAATLAIDYTGRVVDLSPGLPGDEEGLFRERLRGRWYLYSQAESSFARRIVPCFDEPRFKPAWRVTAIVPRGQVALGNAPVRAERARPDGRREVRFAEVAALPSYLLALAVGPFDVVAAGPVGRGRVPVRLAVAAGDGGRARAPELARVVTALERYLDAPLPLAKLDLVAVPAFFGAMENPGLITVESEILVGGRERAEVLAHELAHQWFGDAVTPAWWDHLWLSEAFATWLAAKVADELGLRRPPVIAHRARAAALAADAAPDARPLIHPVAAAATEPAFDALAYEKGAAVLAMFEQLDPAAFQRAVRGYLARHAGRAVTSEAFLAALADATSPALAAALASNLAHAGAPVVTVRCRDARITVDVADGVTLPVCLRYRDPPRAHDPAGDVRRCVLAGHAALAVAACPAWLVGNAGGRGYYRLADPLAAPLGPLTADELLAHGDDVIAALDHGELALPAALAEALRLAAGRDPDAGYAALAIARAIAGALVVPAIRPWTPRG
jgi:alanyl aminopeptidase